MGQSGSRLEERSTKEQGQAVMKGSAGSRGATAVHCRWWSRSAQGAQGRVRDRIPGRQESGRSQVGIPRGQS